MAGFTRTRHTVAEPSGTGGVCRSCFKTSETEPVSVKRDGQWADSTVRRCVNVECHAVREGSLEDRLAHVLSVYGYKYFGDYELSPEQMDAVGEAVHLARQVPALLAALRAALEFVEDEAENRAAAGSEYSDYEREPRELADSIRAALRKAEAGE